MTWVSLIMKKEKLDTFMLPTILPSLFCRKSVSWNPECYLNYVGIVMFVCWEILHHLLYPPGPVVPRWKSAYREPHYVMFVCWEVSHDCSTPQARLYHDESLRIGSLIMLCLYVEKSRTIALPPRPGCTTMKVCVSGVSSRARCLWSWSERGPWCA